MYLLVRIATNKKKKATMQKAAKKLNLDLTNEIIAEQQLAFRHPYYSF